MHSLRLLASLTFLITATSAADSPYRIDVRHADTTVLRDHLKLGGANSRGDRISFTSLSMEENGRPVLPVIGEFHFSRYPNAYWDESLRKMKAGGIEIVATYVFWNIHEEVEGKFDWSGDRDLHHFLELCAKNNLRAIVRIGPFCHGEMRNGGLPDWLYGRPFNVRSNDAPYLHYVEWLYGEIGRQLDGLLFKDGGPVIGIQLENELHHSAAPWAFSYPGQPPEWTNADPDRYRILDGAGKKRADSYADEGRKHLAALKELAQKAGIEAPLLTATGWGNAAVLPDETIPVTSAYPFPTWAKAAPSPLYLYKDLHSHPDYAPVSYDAKRYPSFGAELGGGIMVTYSRRPTIPPQSVEALVVRELGGGANAIGYYMYHGGATPRGKFSYLSEEATGVPKISYDFQAPIGQYGQLAESYSRLKLIHFFLRDFGAQLAPMVTILPESAANVQPTDVDQLRYAVRWSGKQGFLFMHNFQDHVPTHDLTDLQIAVQTDGEEIRIPRSASMSLNSQSDAIFPINIDFGGVRVKSATAQPLATLPAGDRTHYTFVAVDGIPPEFVIDPKTIGHFDAGDCQSHSDQDALIVQCSSDKISQFTLDDSAGRHLVFTTFPKAMALHAWLVENNLGKHLVFSEATILPDHDRLELHSPAGNHVCLSVYPELKRPPQFRSAPLSSTPPPHPSMSSYELTLPEIDPFVHAKVADRRTLVISTEKAELPDGVNDVFLDIDYTGDVGMAFMGGQLVDDHFYFGQPWRIGVRRFFPKLATDGMTISFRPINKDSPFLSDLPPAAVPDFASAREVLKINQVRVLPEYCAVLNF